MALNIATGTFKTGTTTADIVVSGLGFQPKMGLVWMVGRTEAAAGVSEANLFMSLGMFSGVGEEACIVGSSKAVAGRSECDRGMRDDSCLARLNLSAVFDGLASFKSFQAGGFTLQVDDAFDADYTVMYWVAGGDDLTDAKVIQWVGNNAEGDQDVTSLSFQPDALIQLNTRNGSTPPVTFIDMLLSIGVCAGTGDSDNAVLASAGDNLSDPTDTIGFATDGEFTPILKTPETVVQKGKIKAFLSNGFRITWQDSNQNVTRYFTLAFKGGQWKVGSITTATDTTPVSETSVAFKPVGLLLGSASRAKDVSEEFDFGESTDHAQVSIGAAAGPTSRFVQAYRDEKGLTAPEITTGIRDDAMYMNVDDAGEAGVMDLDSFNNNGFTWRMDDADPTASYAWYLAGGSNPIASETILIKRRF